MATPKKKGKGRVAGKHDKRKKTAQTYKVKPHRYSITFAVGRPLMYETPEALQKEIDEYFDYIKGEYEEKEVIVTDPKTKKRKPYKQEVCIREPEPATITGLTLFLGFSSLEALTEYEKRGPKFSEVVRRGKLRVSNRYERNLHGTAPTGSIFALKNMGWKDSNFLDPGEGNEMGIIAFKYITPQKPNDDEE